MTTSTINPTQPVTNSDLASAPVRDNFVAAYNDINNIYILLTSLGSGLGTMAQQNADAVVISGGTISGVTISASTLDTLSGDVTIEKSDPALVLYDTDGGGLNFKVTSAASVFSIQQISGVGATLSTPFIIDTGAVTLEIKSDGAVLDGQYILTGTIQTADIDNQAVTFVKIQNVSTDRLVGRDTAGTGSVEQLTVTGGVEFTGSGGIQRSAISGDITIPAGSNTSAITAGVIVDADINSAAAIDATKIGSGAVTSTEFGYLDGVTSAIQTQINNKQPLDATLTALAAFNTNGIMTQTAADTFTARTITGTAAEITVTNGSGVSGNPIISIPAVIDLGGKTSLEIPNSAAPSLGTDGQIAIDTTVTDFSQGQLSYYSGEQMFAVSMPILQFTSPTDGYVVTYDASAEEFQLKAGGGGGGAVSDVSNSDGTLTISPTTGSVVASLALGHANTWTGKQIFNTSSIQLGTTTASTALVTDGSKNVVSSAVTATELGYVSGVTSAIQTQINTKAPTASPTFTGTVTLPAGQVVNGVTLVSGGTASLYLSQDGTYTTPAGGGTVTSVSGTSNRITSTGGTTPVIDISAFYVGQSSITTLGTIATGTWSATTIAPTKGGTGITTYATGDILYSSASNVLSKLAAGTDGYVLTLASGIPAWSPATGSSYSPKKQLFASPGDFTPGSTTTLTLTNTPIATVAADIQIEFDGIGQFSDQWSYNAGTGVITFTAAIPVGVDAVECYWGAASSSTPGTVTSVSVVSTNGFAGSVATSTTTPAITLTTTITGLLKGNGTAISAATAGTDYVTASSTNTFTNKTYDTAGTGNSFSINGLAATANTGTGSVVRATSPALVTPDLGTPTALVGTNISGTGASFTAGTATLASTVSTVNEATDTTCFPLFVTASGTQSLQPKNNTSFTFNSNTGALGATTLGGTLTTAAQANITSLGTLTALTMGGTLAMGSNSITMTGSLAATGSRVTKGWFTDIESTNTPTVGGVALPTATSTTTFTNKRNTKRTGTTASSGTPTINTDNVDYYSITALAANITSFTTNLSGTPTDAQTLWISITDNGTSRTISWGASFEASTVSIPTATTISTRMDVGFIWNTATTKWRCVAVS